MGRLFGTGTGSVCASVWPGPEDTDPPAVPVGAAARATVVVAADTGACTTSASDCACEAPGPGTAATTWSLMTLTDAGRENSLPAFKSERLGDDGVAATDSLPCSDSKSEKLGGINCEILTM